MSPFALRLRTLNATALGNESAFRQETDRSASVRALSLCNSDEGKNGLIEHEQP
jgi:hypothetical protein